MGGNPPALFIGTPLKVERTGAVTRTWLPPSVSGWIRTSRAAIRRMMDARAGQCSRARFRPMKNIISILLLLSALLLGACGDDDGGGGGGSDPSCDEVCATLGNLCEEPPQCTQICENQLSPSQRRCIVASSSCEQADVCASGGTPDSGMLGGTDSGVRDAGSDANVRVDSGPAAECAIGEIENCPAPSVSCTSIAFGSGRQWCSPACGGNEDCAGGDFVCQISGPFGVCVPRCYSDRVCPAPFSTCELTTAVEGFCR